MPRTRVHQLNVSLDGYAAGDHVTFDAPIGGAERLFTWFDGRVIHGVDKADAPVTLDRALTSMWSQGIGAEIMGRRKFGPQVGDWPDDGWRGWWGDEPPFQTPVFVMSHHPHPTIDFPNGTSFRFVDGPPEEVLRLAQQAAGGRDVRIGGGPSTVRPVPPGRPARSFMHLVIVPLLSGAAYSLWEGSSGLKNASPSSRSPRPAALLTSCGTKTTHLNPDPKTGTAPRASHPSRSQGWLRGTLPRPGGGPGGDRRRSIEDGGGVGGGPRGGPSGRRAGGRCGGRARRCRPAGR